MAKEQKEQTVQTEAGSTSAASVTANLNSADRSQDVIEIDLKELFFALLSRWKLILLVTLIGAVIVGAYHTFFVDSSYEAEAIIYITSNDSVISLSDLQVSSQLTEDYAIIIKSRPVLNKVIEELELDMNYKELGQLVSVNNPDSTHMIEITVVTDDLEMSRNIVNSLLNASITQIYQVIGSGEPTIVDYSEAEAVEDVTPSLLRYIVMGALAGFVLACMFVVARVLMNTLIRTEEDIEKYLGMPVLASVPYYRASK
ncbi:MAG: Wzz/FepE/Etk N-terminal domain-containing protein [Lachnospiraceae bacterium]|nr:Wzz/FepE/Etk N-terminal domain-containing protein [Lachnospiraceae bacterium]